MNVPSTASEHTTLCKQTYHQLLANMYPTALNNNQPSAFGIRLFLIAEILLFGSLFIVYLVYRSRHAQAFHFAAGELSLFAGVLNTIILLISSTTLVMSAAALRQNNKRLALQLTGITFLLGIFFLLSGCLEWQGHITDRIYPASSVLALRGPGDVLFYGMYFFITGLHILHVIIGLTIIGFLIRGIARGKINSGNYFLTGKKGLYWHLIVFLWILIFPLFYIIT
jgi:cytochrome c oxidase subunit 3